MKEIGESPYPAPFEITGKIYQKQIELKDTEYQYGLDWWFWAFRETPGLVDGDILPFEQAEKRVNEILEDGKRLAYLSGGFDLGPHHSHGLSTLDHLVPQDVFLLIGIEPDSYIKDKGRDPVFDQKTRLFAVATLLKQRGKLAFGFAIPERPSEIPIEEFYEDLVKNIGVYRREGCYHLYTLGDPHREVKKQRMINQEEWCELPVFGRLSVTDLLDTKVVR